MNKLVDDRGDLYLSPGKLPCYLGKPFRISKKISGLLASHPTASESFLVIRQSHRVVPASLPDIRFGFLMIQAIPPKP
uniref:Uncharacterized protein n=1 Tax=Candidatus Kentrum sp. MB TaxID=2138164 RepID=A0A451BBC7_9GAMM|nr:MAG: hypothetical protein BECKMB1821I_GA0114274_10262 [Candidatus Kentron sp. MB]VFK75603.1 MAG: hypothetical protein BECKMB1821H_GA0114242_10272 [Candidatus Kentron sp. MB]